MEKKERLFEQLTAAQERRDAAEAAFLGTPEGKAFKNFSNLVMDFLTKKIQASSELLEMFNIAAGNSLPYETFERLETARSQEEIKAAREELVSLLPQPEADRVSTQYMTYLSLRAQQEHCEEQIREKLRATPEGRAFAEASAALYAAREAYQESEKQRAQAPLVEQEQIKIVGPNVEERNSRLTALKQGYANIMHNAAETGRLPGLDDLRTAVGIGTPEVTQPKEEAASADMNKYLEILQGSKTTEEMNTKLKDWKEELPAAPSTPSKPQKSRGRG